MSNADLISKIAQILEPWAWETTSYNATCARDDATSKATQIVDAFAASTARPTERDYPQDFWEATTEDEREALFATLHGLKCNPSIDEIPLVMTEVVAILRKARPTERGAVEEAAHLAAWKAIYGPGADPFFNPEGFDFASKVADAVVAALPATDQAAEVERPRLLNTDEARLALWKAIEAISIGNATDDKLIVANLAKAGVYLATQPATGRTMGGEDGDDLRPWGWAPGGYVFRCRDCPDDLDIDEKLGRLGDKYSWRCEEHAKAARAALQNGGE